MCCFDITALTLYGLFLWTKSADFLIYKKCVHRGGSPEPSRPRSSLDPFVVGQISRTYLFPEPLNVNTPTVRRVSIISIWGIKLEVSKGIKWNLKVTESAAEPPFHVRSFRCSFHWLGCGRVAQICKICLKRRSKVVKMRKSPSLEGAA